jgi:hypothetical protein
MKNNGKKFLITVALMLFLNIVLACLCYFLFNFVNSQKKELAKTKNEIIEYNERIKNIEQLQSSLGQFEGQRADIGSLLLNKTSIVNFVEELEYLSEKTGVDLEMKKVDVSQGGENAPNFQFSVSGEFDDVYHFLYLLENDVYYVGFEMVDISKIKIKEKEIVIGENKEDKQINESIEDKWKGVFEIRLLSFKG